MSHAFAHDTLTDGVAIADYNDALEEFVVGATRESCDFRNPLYLGHMNYDVGAPHVDALRKLQNINENQVAVFVQKRDCTGPKVFKACGLWA